MNKSCCAFLIALFACAAPAQESDSGFWHKLGAVYQAPEVPANRYQDTARLKTLMREGQLYLSLDDAIALAVENNLDVAVQRYLPVFAAADVLRTQSGALVRGLQLTVREGPPGVGGPSSPVLTGGTDNTNSQADVNLALGQITGIGSSPISPGSPIPRFDPNIVGQYGWIHNTTPQANEGSFGVPSLVTGTTVFNTGYVQGFSPGTQLAVTFNNTRHSLNAPNIDYNPYTAGSVGLTVTQPLLQGFGTATNKRFIRIARNNEKIADLTFQQQLVATVSAVMRLYYDLVSVNQDVEVKQQALKRAEALLENNRVQVEVGTLAPIEVVRAQAEVARSRQALTNSESLVFQQEVILKNFLSRRGTDDPEIRSARLVATDHIRIPDKEAPQNLEELVQQAFKNRPDYLQAVIQLDNARVALKGSKNALLPQLDLVGTVSNNGLAGEVNPLALPGSGAADQAFLGGYGTLMSQIFRRNYPDYGVFVQLNIPLRNRQARADMMRDSAQANQSELRLEQLKHQVQTEVEAAIIALQRARAGYDAARQTRVLQEQTLQAEQEKYSVGATTSFFLIQYQRDLAQARSDEVLAESLYAKAQTALERAVGIVLTRHNIEFDEAYNGQLRR
ncbi:MAG: outer rane efflux protein [Acidobacteria bacterium]|nr:outer rane efflux protein [Acidobacteriota bacterium]